MLLPTGYVPTGYLPPSYLGLPGTAAPPTYFPVSLLSVGYLPRGYFSVAAPPLPPGVAFAFGPPVTSIEGPAPFSRAAPGYVHVPALAFVEADGTSPDLTGSALFSVALTDGRDPVTADYLPATVLVRTGAGAGAYARIVPLSLPAGGAACVWVRVGGVDYRAGILPLTD